MKAVERGQELLVVLKKDYPELKLSPVFSRFGASSGQCDLTTDLRKIVMTFPDMLAGEFIHREGAQGTQKENVDATPSSRSQRAGEENFCHERAQEGTKKLQKLLIQLKQGEPVEKEADALEKELLAPDLPLYCGDVLIEFRPGNLKYESLRRLQQDSRLPPGLNEVGNIRVIAGSLELLSKEV